jgi:hypothetical protein
MMVDHESPSLFDRTALPRASAQPDWNGDWTAPVATGENDWSGKEDADWPELDPATYGDDDLGAPDWLLFYAMIVISVATLLFEIVLWVIR